MESKNKLVCIAKRFVSGEFPKFLIVGGANTVLSYILYVLLLKYFAYPIAYTIAWVEAVVFSYVVNSLLVFKKDMTVKKAIFFPTVYLLQYALGVSLLWTLVELVHVPEKLAPVCIVLISVPVTFFMSKIIISRD